MWLEMNTVHDTESALILSADNLGIVVQSMINQQLVAL